MASAMLLGLCWCWPWPFTLARRAPTRFRATRVRSPEKIFRLQPIAGYLAMLYVIVRRYAAARHFGSRDSTLGTITPHLSGGIVRSGGIPIEESDFNGGDNKTARCFVWM